MEKYYLQTVGMPVVSSHGERLGRIGDVIINPDSGKVAGFFLAPSNKKVIAAIDVLSWTDYVKISDEQDIVETDEVIQINNILEQNIPVFRNKVYTKDGDYVGVVIDIGFDNKFFSLTCLVVAKGFLGIVFWDKKIIAAQDILEITKNKIIIKNLVKPVKMRKLRVDMAPAPQ